MRHWAWILILAWLWPLLGGCAENVATREIGSMVGKIVPVLLGDGHSCEHCGARRDGPRLVAGPGVRAGPVADARDNRVAPRARSIAARMAVGRGRETPAGADAMTPRLVTP